MNIFYNKKNGFTLVETLVSLSIFILIMMVVSTFAVNIFSFNRIAFTGFSGEDEARKIIRPMAGEIRSLSPSSIGAYPIETVTASTFTFYADTNNDGLKERVRYFTSGNILKKGVITPTGNPLTYNAGNEVITDVVHGVLNPSSVFSYYDSNYDGTAGYAALTNPVDPSLVRLIKVTVTVDSNGSIAPGPTTISTQVSPRNLKSNL